MGRRFFRFVTLHAFNRRTERERDRQTDGLLLAIPRRLHTAHDYRAGLQSGKNSLWRTKAREGEPTPRRLWANVETFKVLCFLSILWCQVVQLLYILGLYFYTNLVSKYWEYRPTLQTTSELQQQHLTFITRKDGRVRQSYKMGKYTLYIADVQPVSQKNSQPCYRNCNGTTIKSSQVKLFNNQLCGQSGRIAM